MKLDGGDEPEVREHIHKIDQCIKKQRRVKKRK
jgi:hypothetical protein